MFNAGFFQYQGLDRLRQDYPNIPIMALTATANEQVMKDVIDRLGIKGCVLLTQSFNRPNLHYDVRSKGRTVLADINQFIQTYHRNQTGIIYCLSRNKCEEVAKELREKYSLRARHYHALMTPEDKNRAQTAWQNGQCDIIVATIAFGMGIDKPDVRYVIHHSLPMSLDGYYQETGRAGRDGKPASCILYYSFADTKILYKLIQDGDKTLEERKRQEDGVRAVIQYCQNDIDCRRVQVLGYFGQNFDPKDCNKSCNNCLDTKAVIEEDMTDMAIKAIQLVENITSRDGNVTKLHCLDVFRGANIKTIRDRGHDRLSLYGAGSSLSREQGERIFDHLLSLDGFEQVSVTNKSGWNSMYLRLGKSANDFLLGKLQLKLMTKIVHGHSETTIKEKSISIKSKLPKKKPVFSSFNRSVEDTFCDDDEPSSRAPSRQHAPADDIYDFGSSPLPSPVKSHSQGQNRTAVDIKLENAQRCHKVLLECTRKNGAGSLPSDIDHDIWESISFVLPTDHASLDEFLSDYMPSSEKDGFLNLYGKTILQICTPFKQSNSTAASTNSQLISQYSFKPKQTPRR